MNTTAIALQKVSEQLPRRKQARRNGRSVAATTLEEVREALGALPLRRDMLIEHLHALNDRHGQLRSDHLAALAQWLKLSQVEVYEVASFYHHFDVVREDAQGGFAAAPKLTVRVCSGLSCELAGAQALLDKLPALLGTDVRVLEAPCVGRCEQAPVAVVHQRAVPRADAAMVQALVEQDQRHDTLPEAVDKDGYIAQGGYGLLRDCHAGVLCAELSRGTGLREAVGIANAAAAIAVTRRGPATCPSRIEVEKLLAMQTL